MPERAIGQLQLFPSSRTSADWAAVSAAVRNNSFFSACVEDERILSALQKLVDKAAGDGWSVGGFIDEALHMLESIATDASEKDKTFNASYETLYDVERLRLIYMTQMQLTNGYSNFCRSFSPFQLNAFPAWRFHRQPGAKEENKRSDHVQHEGDVRLKTDIEYWLDRNRAEIGGFGNPYGPWGFNSWMHELPVAREEAERLGLIAPGEKLPIPPALAEWNLPQAIQQVGKQGVSDLTPEQRQNVITRCADEGITVDQPTESTLQVVPSPDTPDEPLAALEAAVVDAWVTQQVQEIAEQSKVSPLELAFGMFVTWWLKDLFEEDEEVKASGRRLKHPRILEDGSRCFTEDCSRHKGTTREGESAPFKTQAKQNKESDSVLFKDERCSVVKYSDGCLVVHAHQAVTEKQAAESLQRLIAQCRELRKGQMRAKPDYGFIAPGEQTEFFVSGRTIKESVENDSHIAKSENMEAHLTAASLFDRLWESSQNGIRRKPKKNKPKDKQIKWVHERYALMKLKKSLYRVKMTAFEYKKSNNDNLLYDIKVIKSGDLSKSLMR